MIKKNQRILFLICLILFLLIAPSIILYSQGYRIDFKNKKITQTGGLFLKVFPKNVDIYLDRKLKKRTDFFFGSVLIENLLPKKHQIKISKEGYHHWEKNLEIEEKKVTEVKNVILFLKNPNFSILTKEIENFWISPDKKKLILYEINELGWNLKSYDFKKNIKSHLLNEIDVYQKGADLINLNFSEDSKEIYLEVLIKKEKKLFSLNLNKIPLFLTEKKSLKQIKEENIIVSKKINNDIYYLDKFGHFFKNGEKLTEKSFPIKKELEYKIYVFSDLIFLQEDKNLYLFSSELKCFEKFFESINSIEISPDSKKIFYSSNSEIWVLFLRDNPPLYQAKEKISLIRLSEKIEDCFWLNSDYLIFKVGNKIKFMEIDKRDRINIIDFVDKFKEPKIFWNYINKKLYLLSEGNLFVSEKLF